MPGFYIPLFQYFTNFTPVSPLYWDVMSQEERILAICKEIDKLVAYCDKIGVQVNYNTEEIEKLWEEMDKFIDGKYDDKIRAVVSAWVNSHMPDIISQTIKMVFFGLDSTGHFVAYFPDSWDDLIFDTGMIYGQSDYGRLILSY